LDPEGVPDVGVPDEPELAAPLDPEEPLSEPLVSLVDVLASLVDAGLSSLFFVGLP
jgi:hypothetical protein